MQMSQKEAFTSMAEAAEKRGFDIDFASIPIFNGKNKSYFHKWYTRLEYTCTYSKRDLRHKLLCRSSGAVTTILHKVDKNLRSNKMKILQEHFGE